MDLKWLEDLVAIGKTGNLARAADLRHVTPPRRVVGVFARGRPGPASRNGAFWKPVLAWALTF
jgi:hypothetical protein